MSCRNKTAKGIKTQPGKSDGAGSLLRCQLGVGAVRIFQVVQTIMEQAIGYR